MIEQDLEVSILKSLSYLEFLIGLLNKLSEGLEDKEIQGLVYVLEVIRDEVLEIKDILVGNEEKP